MLEIGLTYPSFVAILNSSQQSRKRAMGELIYVRCSPHQKILVARAQEAPKFLRVVVSVSIIPGSGIIWKFLT